MYSNLRRVANKSMVSTARCRAGCIHTSISQFWSSFTWRNGGTGKIATCSQSNQTMVNDSHVSTDCDWQRTMHFDKSINTTQYLFSFAFIQQQQKNKWQYCSRLAVLISPFTCIEGVLCIWTLFSHQTWLLIIMLQNMNDFLCNMWYFSFPQFVNSGIYKQNLKRLKFCVMIYIAVDQYEILH